MLNSDKGFKSNQEFITYVLTNRSFQDIMARIPYKKRRTIKDLFKHFVDTLAKAFKLYRPDLKIDNTLLSSAIESSFESLGEMRNQIGITDDTRGINYALNTDIIESTNKDVVTQIAKDPKSLPYRMFNKLILASNTVKDIVLANVPTHALYETGSMYGLKSLMKLQDLTDATRAEFHSKLERDTKEVTDTAVRALSEAIEIANQTSESVKRIGWDLANAAREAIEAPRRAVKERWFNGGL